MRLEVNKKMVHCQLRQKQWIICRCDIEAWQFLRSLPVLRDWMLVGEDFEESAIQRPGRPKQGTRMVIFATPEPTWFGEKISNAAKQLAAGGKS